MSPLPANDRPGNPSPPVCLSMACFQCRHASKLILKPPDLYVSFPLYMVHTYVISLVTPLSPIVSHRCTSTPGILLIRFQIPIIASLLYGLRWSFSQGAVTFSCGSGHQDAAWEKWMGLPECASLAQRRIKFPPVISTPLTTCQILQSFARKPVPPMPPHIPCHLVALPPSTSVAFLPSPLSVLVEHQPQRILDLPAKKFPNSNSSSNKAPLNTEPSHPSTVFEPGPPNVDNVPCDHHPKRRKLEDILQSVRHLATVPQEFEVAVCDPSGSAPLEDETC